MSEPRDEVEMSANAIADATGLDAETARLYATALSEAQTVFNAARKIDAQKVTITRRTLWALMEGCAENLGLENLGPKNLQ